MIVVTYKLYANKIHVKNLVYNCYFDNLVKVKKKKRKTKKLETKNILIDEKL